MADERAVLEASVERLRTLVAGLGPEELRAQAYPSEWTVADVLSHLGSGAVIASRSLDEALGGVAAAPPQSIWDEWNAKAPDAKALAALNADRALIERLHALSDDECHRLNFSVGPMSVDYACVIRLRINEHLRHTWDIGAVFDPSVGLSPDGVVIVFETLPMIARFTGKPTGATRELFVHTTEPDRDFVVGLSVDAVSIKAADGVQTSSLELPGEAFARLIYGRLDLDHTPAFKGDEAGLEELRHAFPGV